MLDFATTDSAAIIDLNCLYSLYSCLSFYIPPYHYYYYYLLSLFSCTYSVLVLLQKPNFPSGDQ